MSHSHEMLRFLQELVPANRRKLAISMDTTLVQLGVDSLGLVMLVTRFIDEFKVDPSALTQTDFARVTTVGELLALGQTVLGEARKSASAESGSAS